MKVYRYSVEGYEDWMHKYGHFKGYKIYIPEPYNFGIFTLNNKITYIKRQDKVDNFKNDMFGFNPTINEIEMDEELIKKFHNNLIEEEKVLNERKTLENELLQFRTTDELGKELFEEGLDLLHINKYEDSIDKYQKCIEFEFSKKESWYNIACCYSKMNDKDKTIESLQKAFNNGYDNWFHTVTDSDLKNFIDEPECVNIVKEMLLKNPRKVWSSKITNKDGTDLGDTYLNKHDLRQYYPFNE